MSKSPNEDLLDTYKIITSKLRKRFLRKPNVAEASDEFNSLAIRCERSQALEFSGLCWLGVAKCEGSLGNSYLEIESLLKAAHSFNNSRNFSKKIGCSCMRHEITNASLNCYHHAISRFRENSPLCVASHIEAKNVLNDQLVKDIDFNQITQIHPALTIHTLTSRLQQLIDNGDYTNALEVLTLMDSSINISSSSGIFRDLLIRNEITKVLLLVMLEPPIGKLSVSQAKLIEKYSWVDFKNPNEIDNLPEQLGLLVCSLVAAWQCRDIDSINDIKPKIVAELTNIQRRLLNDLIRDRLM
ncbi:factor VIII intron 22 protein [Ctenocephalides felis]|uniref:factor VIII intron 22 protein n=1 Tax=Ctenocephalides felis TaxID=7515 RepID=UPI000E6E3159|nr:factor VIII intron 22 protein [Ctenocephalides felis]